MRRPTTLAASSLTFALELPFILLMPYASVQALTGGQSNAQLWWSLAGFQLARVLATQAAAHWKLRPIERWREARGDRQVALLPDAARAADRVPTRLGIVWGTSWAAYFLFQTWCVDRLVVPLSATHWAATSLLCITGFAGAFPVAGSILGSLLAPLAGEISVQARRAGLELQRAPRSLQRTLLIFAGCVALAPTSWLTFLLVLRQVEASLVLLFWLGALVWAPIVAIFVARSIGGPLRALAREVSNLGPIQEVTGQEQIPTVRADELGELSNAAQLMLRRLADSSHRLRQSLIEKERLIGEAKRALRIRDDFLSIAAHELRTPLTSLSLYLETIERDANRNTPIAPEKIARARRQVRQLTVLIGDLLDVSRIQAGALSIQKEPVYVHHLLRDVAHGFHEVSPLHQIRLDLAEQPLWVAGDHARLDQVVSNLLDNAIKYSPEGGTIELGLRRQGDQVVLWVKDQGVGIPPAEQAQVFDRFVQGSRGGRLQMRGLGLGLYICRDLVHRHGGHIWMESELGKGTQFFVSLPVLEPPRPRPPEVALQPSPQPGG